MGIGVVAALIVGVCTAGRGNRFVFGSTKASPLWIGYSGTAGYSAEWQRLMSLQAQVEHTAALVARFRRKTGRWPADGPTLARLYGDRQTSPWADTDHRALDYRLRETGLRLMSVGAEEAQYEFTRKGGPPFPYIVAKNVQYPP